MFVGRQSLAAHATAARTGDMFGTSHRTIYTLEQHTDQQINQASAITHLQCLQLYWLCAIVLAAPATIQDAVDPHLLTHSAS